MKGWLKPIGFLPVAIAVTLLAAAVVSRAAGNTIVVQATAREPGIATDGHMAITGRCGGKKTGVAVETPPLGGIRVVVEISGRRTRYDMATPFVRDLFGGKAILKYFIVCAGSGFELTAWGTTFDDSQSAQFVEAIVIFDSRGRVDQYSGLMPEKYEWIRGHLE
jgi:hypothetical protein